MRTLSVGRNKALRARVKRFRHGKLLMPETPPSTAVAWSYSGLQILKGGSLL